MKPFVLSYTALKTFEQCPAKFYHLFVAKDIKEDGSREALDFGIRAHTAMEKRLKHGEVLPDEFWQYERFAVMLDDHPCKIELKAGLTIEGRACGFFDERVWFRGKLDVSIVYDDKAFILDWKTGKKPAPNWESADELELFGVMLKAAQPQLTRITGSYAWLKEGVIGVTHDLSDTAVKLAQLRGRYEKIEQALRFKRFPEEEGALCPWCPVKTCRYHPEKE